MEEEPLMRCVRSQKLQRGADRVQAAEAAQLAARGLTALPTVPEAQRFAPGRAVFGHPGPHLAVDVELVERLAKCATVRHRRRTTRPLVRHP